MKKNVLLSIAALAIILVASFGFSGPQTENDNFVPVEKGKTYQIFLFNARVEITILEEPKGEWVKADIHGKGVYYMNLNQIPAISAKEN